jgi:hypothetical protein
MFRIIIRLFAEIFIRKSIWFSQDFVSIIKKKLCAHNVVGVVEEEGAEVLKDS